MVGTAHADALGPLGRRRAPEAPFNYENYAEMYGPLIAQAQASGTPEP